MGRCPLFVFESHFTQLIDRIRAIAERVAGSYGLEIYDVQFRRGGRPTYTAFRTVETDDESLFNSERVFEVQIGMSAWTHWLRFPI